MDTETLQSLSAFATSITVNGLLLYLWRNAENRAMRAERKHTELLEILAGIRHAPAPDTLQNKPTQER